MWTAKGSIEIYVHDIGPHFYNLIHDSQSQ